MGRALQKTLQTNEAGNLTADFCSVLRIFIGLWTRTCYEVDVDSLCLMTWCLWWALQQQARSSAADRGPSAKPLVLFHLDHWTSAEPHDWGGETSDCKATVWPVCAFVLVCTECVSYSQYCSLGLCTGTVIMLDAGQVLFSWVQLATKTPLTLQYTRKVKNK